VWFSLYLKAVFKRTPKLRMQISKCLLGMHMLEIGIPSTVK
jgi:hypothetical protein